MYSQNTPPLPATSLHPCVASAFLHTCCGTVAHLTSFRRRGTFVKSPCGLVTRASKTTEDYLRVDVTQRIGVLDAVIPPQLRPGKFRPSDKLIASLRG